MPEGTVLGEALQEHAQLLAMQVAIVHKAVQRLLVQLLVLQEDMALVLMLIVLALVL